MMSKFDLNRLDPKIAEIALAGLLHDIGKPRQRACEELSDGHYHVCPCYNGQKSHIHAAHTAYFFEQPLMDKGFDSGVAYKSSCNHHLGFGQLETGGELAVKIGDRLASGHDRRTHELYAQNVSEDYVKQQAGYITARMINPFGKVQTAGRGIAKKEMILPLKPLSPEILPMEARSLKKEAAVTEYRELWRGFESAFKTQIAPYEATNNWLNSVAVLMEQYFFAVPASSFGNLPETSLYDHCRLVAAFASALYLAHEEGVALDEATVDEQMVFRLVQGDFSGIQSFIFDFRGDSQRNAAKILRARSFYVAAATEAAAAMVCAEFGLSHLSIALNAGGKFTVLVPNLKDCDEKLEKVRNLINRSFYRESFGQTRFNLASVPARGRDFEGTSQAFGNLMGNLAAALEKQKLQPYVEGPVFKGYLDSFGTSGEAQVCPTCSYRPAGLEDGEIKPCKVCARFRSLGSSLVREGNDILVAGDPDDLSGLNGIRLWEGLVLAVTDRKSSEKAGPGVVRWHLRAASQTSASMACGSRRLAAYVPRFGNRPESDPRYASLGKQDQEDDNPAEGEIKSFGHIACDGLNVLPDQRTEGVAFLGVLKADVDNLGEVFMGGQQSHLSKGLDFSRAATLSRQLDFFFTGWLNYHIQKEERYNSTYTVFAGGDDLFLIGPWNRMLDLGKEIASRFRSYTGDTPSMSLSAGIEVAKPGVSLLRIAEKAEEALKASKHRKQTNEDVKNAVTVFGRTVSWSNLEDLLGRGEKMLGWLRGQKVSTGLIHNLLTFTGMRESLDSNDRYSIHDAGWRALLRYSVIRNVKANDKEGEVIRNELLEVGRAIQEMSGDFRIAVFKALYEVR